MYGTDTNFRGTEAPASPVEHVTEQTGLDALKWMLCVARSAACGCAVAALSAPASLAQNGTAAAPQGWPPDAAGLRLHMIGNAHVDAPWLWPLSEATAVVHSTFRSALDRM